MENFEPLTCNPLQQQTVAGDFTDEITLITEMSTFKKLAVLNPTKAHGPDAILRWLLKENADLLAGPICDILNDFYHEGRLPSVWKEADIVPVPVTTNQRRKQAPTPNLTHTHNLQDCCCVSGPFWNMLVQFSTVHYQLTWRTIWNVYKDVLALFTLPCLTLKPSAHQDYLHYLREEKKSP